MNYWIIAICVVALIGTLVIEAYINNNKDKFGL